MQNTEALRVKLQGKTRGLSDKGLCAYLRGCYEFHNAIMQDAAQDLIDRYHAADKKKQPFLCFRQLDLAPFDGLIWPHPLVHLLSAPGRSEALRRPKGDAFRA